jgi:hypothetical protein
MLEEKLALSVVDVELNEDLAPTTGRSWRDSMGGMEAASPFFCVPVSFFQPSRSASRH